MPDAATAHQPAFRIAFLAPRFWPVWLALGLLRLLHLLPRPLILPLVARAGDLYRRLSAKRRHIAAVNLRLAFPHHPEAARAEILRDFFRRFAVSAFDLGLLWWGSRTRVGRLIQVEGMGHYEAARKNGRNVILLTGHFLALEAGAAALTARYPLFGLVKPARNPLIDWMLTRGRLRYSAAATLFPRDRGMMGVVRAIKRGQGFYYLPDEDFGPQRSVFAPLLGTVAATLPTLGRLAALTDAVVLPCVARLDAGGHYTVTLAPPLPDYPSGDDARDAAQMNAALGDLIRPAPEQYLWSFKFFKTRPDGAAAPY